VLFFTFLYFFSIHIIQVDFSLYNIVFIFNLYLLFNPYFFSIHIIQVDFSLYNIVFIFNLYLLFNPYILIFLLFTAPYFVLFIVIFMIFCYISENKVIN
ncbi:hypothetical protein DW841_13105, partial [Hungatella hathewayi]